MTHQLRILFVGTPHFAVPFLRSLLQDDAFHVVGVLTQPDRPSGRKQIITPSPVKEVAKQFHIPVLQPESLKNNSKVIMNIMDLAPDFLVVVAYGQIIPQEILNIAKHGNINVHPSLLPKYRGSSPVQSAILNGDEKTGVTIMLMDAKMDHGPLLLQQEVNLSGTETNDVLHEILAEVGTSLLIQALKNFSSILPQPQEDAEAVFCKTITKDNARIDWSKESTVIEREVRAYYPWPISWTTYQEQRIKIFPPVTPTSLDLKPGELSSHNGTIVVGCGTGAVILEKIQLEGRGPTTAADFLRGNKDIDGHFFL